MATLKDIQKTASAYGECYEDDSTPAGHFGIVAMVGNFYAAYLLEGQIDDPAAAIKGRIVLDTTGKGANTVYVGGNIKGGSFSVFHGAFKDAYTKMV